MNDTADIALSANGVNAPYSTCAGGAATKLPTDSAARKERPIARGVLDYFPRALGEIARVSLQGSKQHHPDKPMHWDMSKSPDEADCIIRHLIERGTLDTDGLRHSAKVAWRALALLERELIAAPAAVT